MIPGLFLIHLAKNSCNLIAVFSLSEELVFGILFRCYVDRPPCFLVKSAMQESGNKFAPFVA